MQKIIKKYWKMGSCMQWKLVEERKQKNSNLQSIKGERNGDIKLLSILAHIIMGFKFYDFGAIQICGNILISDRGCKLSNN